MAYEVKCDIVNNNLPSAEWPAAVGGLTDRRSNRQIFDQAKIRTLNHRPECAC